MDFNVYKFLPFHVSSNKYLKNYLQSHGVERLKLHVQDHIARPPNHLSNDFFHPLLKDQIKTNSDTEVLCDSHVYELYDPGQVF